MTQSTRRLALGVLLLLSFGSVHAQVSLTGGTYNQNFDTLANTGTSSTLPAGWLLSESGTNANTTYSTGTGSGNTGDSYSFGAAGSTERALGGLLSGSLTPTFGACFTNNTGAALGSVDVAYTGEQWRLGTASRTDRIDFQYSLNATSLTTGTWTDVNALDFETPNTATTGTKDGNAVGNRTAISSTISDISIAMGSTICVRWNDFNASGADDGLAVDEFSITVGGPPLPTLSIDDVTQLEGDSGTTSFTFTVSLSTVAPAGGITFDIGTASDSATSGVDFVAKALTGQTIAQGASTYSFEVLVNGDTALEINETFLVNLSNVSAGATIGDGEGQGTITNDDIVITSIGVIQGSGELSPFDGQFMMTEGVVTAKRGNGFFLQSFGSEAGASPDGNNATSDGIFVFTGAVPSMVSVGDHARVAATVDEFLGTAATPTTELVSPSIAVLDSGIALPAPVELTAALAGPNSVPGTLEYLEGMLVRVAAGVVTGQTGGFINEASATSSDSNTAFEFVVAGVPRPFRESGISILDTFPVPLAKEATIPYFDANQERIKAFPLVGTRLVADAGATVTGLVGPLTYFGDSWELLYDVANPPEIGNPTASAVSDAGANDVTVGGFNLQRFFDDTNDPSVGEPVLSGTAFANRLAKTGAAICDWVKTPDILGVVEVENLDTLSQLANYINGNCASAPVYAPYLQEGNDVGGIDVGFLVSNRAVRAGVSRVSVTSVIQMGKDTEYGTSPLGCTPSEPGCTSALLNDRPSLVLRSVVNFANGRTYPLTVIVNHLRSLNGNDDPVSGRVRYKRGQQAVELAKVVNGIQTGNPSEKIVLVGDFNAFPFNDGYVDVMGIITGNPAPEDEVIEYFTSPLATPLVLGDELSADPAQRYSYVFEGNAQTLDHAVVNEALINDQSVVSLSVEHARINADFRVGRYGEFSLPYTAENPPLRVSDHDPVRLKIQLSELTTADLSVSFSAPQPPGRGVAYSDTLTLRNAGPAAAIGAKLHLYLQTTDATVMTVLAPSGWSCRSSTPHYTYDCTASAPVPAGAVLTFKVNQRDSRSHSTSNPYRLEAGIQATTLDLLQDNNNALQINP